MTIRACCSIFSLRMAIFAMNLCLYIIFPCFVVRLCGVFTRTFSYDVGRIGDYSTRVLCGAVACAGQTAVICVISQKATPNFGPRACFWMALNPLKAAYCRCTATDERDKTGVIHTKRL